MQLLKNPLLWLGGILLAAALFAWNEAKADPWNGLYVGGVGSYNALVQDEFAVDAQGPAIAGTIGYDVHVKGSPLVFGALAEYGFGQFDIAGETLDAQGWAAGGRLGVLVNDYALLYGLVKWSDVDLSLDGVDGDVSLTGPVVGGGLEAPLAAGFFVRAEYNYGLLEIEEGGVSEDINTHSGRLGFVYKFGGSDPIIPDLTGPAQKPLK
jgi:opacity protein-like surface antigen